MATQRVVIIGAGFGGLQAAHVLAHKPVEVILIDTLAPLLIRFAVFSAMCRMLIFSSVR
jgi:NADH dehydrogenase FAD-containing subunit